MDGGVIKTYGAIKLMLERNDSYVVLVFNYILCTIFLMLWVGGQEYAKHHVAYELDT